MQPAASIASLMGLLLVNSVLGSTQSAVADASRAEEQGQFLAAARTLQAALDRPSLPAAERKELEFELDRLTRIRKDFPLTREALFASLKAAIRNLRTEEFERWLQDGWFDFREFDGQRRFMGSSVSNLFWRHLELESRRIDPRDDAAYQRALWETCVAIKRAAAKEGKPFVLPKRFQVTMVVTVKAGAVPGGQLIRAWLPVPREAGGQDDFEVVSSSPAIKQLAAATSSIRSAYFEQRQAPGDAPEFRIEYRYTTHGVWFAPDASRVGAFDGRDPEVARFLREGPHVAFTPAMRQLSREIAGDETNPTRKARRFYDWIVENIRYSYAIEYSTIRNIGEYCRARGYGDCGQEALLFITLCRLNGIPARWQSGWNTFPGGRAIHDWTEIYLAPYGWIPVDPWAGIFATRYATALTPAQRREVRDLYFGGLDPYRMAANADHCQTLSPPKQSLRSDTVDFQRGEVEWDSRNVYFDQYSYRLELTELAAASRPPTDSH